MKPATDADMQKARKAINACRDIGKLGDYLATVNERYESGHYTEDQANDLRNLLDVATDLLNEREVPA